MLEHEQKNVWKMIGMRIRRERIKRNWSQSGLCYGICAVSYLSKIEQGKMEVSEEILKLLLERLELPWIDDKETKDLESFVEAQYEFLFTHPIQEFLKQKEIFQEKKEKLYSSSLIADACILEAVYESRKDEIEEGLERYLDFRQLAVLRMLQGRLDEAITLLPIPFMYMRAGEILYETGQNYASAISYLQMGYNLAAQEGMAMLMLQCRIIIGNCYSNQQELENMEREYQIASRLARDLHQTEILKVINYNRASTWVALGSYKKAYDYFSKVEEPAILDLHKLAICCEAYGRKAEGIEAVKRAESMGEFGDDPDDEKQLEVEMCRLVRYRLEHENYLKEEEYEKLLFPCFEKMKARLPVGFAVFHVPYVLEWYTDRRQYKQAYEMMRKYGGFIPVL